MFIQFCICLCFKHQFLKWLVAKKTFSRDHLLKKDSLFVNFITENYPDIDLHNCEGRLNDFPNFLIFSSHLLCFSHK